MGLMSRLEALHERSTEWPRAARSVERRERSPRITRLRRKPAKGDPRPLDADDVDSFMLASGEAAERERRERERKNPPQITPSDADGFVRWIKRRNPQRYNRLQRDLRWLHHEARRYGINPKEVKWLL